MSFELHERKHIDDELRKMSRRQLRRAGETLAGANASTLKTAVHESRKSLKKVRAILQVLEQSGADVSRKDEKRLKRTARELSALRDAAAIIDTFDRVRRRYPTRVPEHTYGILRRGLSRAAELRERQARREGVVDRAVEQLDRTRKAAKGWTAPSLDVAMLIDVAADSYRRSRKAMKRAGVSRQSAALHRWRKTLKTLWYQLRLLKPLTTGVASLVGELKRLETELGEDHNLVVLGATLRGCQDLRWMRREVRLVEQLAARMRPPLRKRALALGRRLHRRKPRAFARWLRSASKPRRRRTAAA
jgi:CHAD domain-containing protein